MKKLILTFTCLCLFSIVFAQNPVRWEYTVKRIAPEQFEVSLTATIERGWHIYSQLTPEGGPLPTEISFNKNPLLIFNSTVKEVGSMQEKHEDVFDVKVKYYNNTVVFRQVVTLSKKVKTKVSGSVKYMVCNDKECLPPKTNSFSMDLK
jgi:hypothetical protein